MTYEQGQQMNDVRVAWHEIRNSQIELTIFSGIAR